MARLVGSRCTVDAERRAAVGLVCSGWAPLALLLSPVLLVGSRVAGITFMHPWFRSDSPSLALEAVCAPSFWLETPRLTSFAVDLSLVGLVVTWRAGDTRVHCRFRLVRPWLTLRTLNLSAIRCEGSRTT